MIEFIEEGHQYRLDGRVVPSVTQILAPLYDFSGVSRELLEHKRQIGQAVHKAIEFDLQEDLDETSLHPEVAQYVPAWRKWRADRDFRAYASERKVGHSIYGYAGTLDLRGNVAQRLPTEKVAPGISLIDLKTTFDVHPAVRLQLIGYRGALATKVKTAAKDKRLALQLMKDGSYEEHWFGDEKDWPNFLSFLACHNWRSLHRC